MDTPVKVALGSVVFTQILQWKEKTVEIMKLPKITVPTMINTILKRVARRFSRICLYFR